VVHVDIRGTQVVRDRKKFGNPCHMCTLIHYTNNTIAHNIDRKNVNGQKIFQHRVGNLAFSCQIANIWSFSEVVWPQIFCLAFSKFFRKFGPQFWPSLSVLPHSGIQTLQISLYASLPDKWSYPF